MELRGNDGDTFLGLDIGGTKIGVAVGRGDGRIVASERIPTDPALAPEELLDRALARLDRLVAANPDGAPRSLGAACPGPITLDGRFLDPPNMPRWHGFDLRGFLAQRVGVPFATMNDANAGALAEWLWGAARGADTAVFCTMSTGMGAGLIVGGRLFQGPRGFAGEIGHIRLRDDGPVGFGKAGSVEGFLSGPGIVQVARAEALCALQTGAATALVAGTAVRQDLDAREVCRLARAGDAAARRATDRCARELGRLCAILVDLLDPDVVVFGTIGAAFPDLFVAGATQVVAAEALAHSAIRLRIVGASLSDLGSQQAIAAARTA